MFDSTYNNDGQHRIAKTVVPVYSFSGIPANFGPFPYSLSLSLSICLSNISSLSPAKSGMLGPFWPLFFCFDLPYLESSNESNESLNRQHAMFLSHICLVLCNLRRSWWDFRLLSDVSTSPVSSF